MKKTFLTFLTAVLTGAAVFAQSGAPTLPRLAVAEFTVNMNTQKANTDAITVRNLSESQIIGTGKYEVIARNEIDALLANQKIAVSSISSSENIKKLQLQNISYIVTGSVDVMGGDYAVTIKILDVSTGKFSHSASDFISSTPRELYAGVNKLVSTFVSGMSSEGGAVVQADTSAVKTGGSGQVYKIGDRGPAGGIVFYDKGVFSNGWQYLEAAPVETERNGIQWGLYLVLSSGPNVSGTATVVGSGKRNTQLIIDALKNLGGHTDKAAQLCASLDYDGYKDWYLPSKDELNLMYTNLKAKGLGGFTDSWYWSSSQYKLNYAWDQRFSDGKQGDSFKHSTRCVRAIRAF